MSTVTTTDAERERADAIHAETASRIDDLKERLAKAESSADGYRKTADVLQVRLDETSREQARLEEKCHEYEEQLESLQNERREAARQMREMESIYEAERSAMTKEKEDMANREEEMQTIIQRLKDSLSQKNSHGDDDLRPGRQSQNNSPGLEQSGFAPPSSINRSDSRNNSKLLLQKDKLIESLRLELAEAQIKLVESENQGGGRLHEVERQLMEARMANARLMEDNESYQLLLQERTLKGDFATTDFSYMNSDSPRRGGAASSNQDALNALEGRSGSADNDAPAARSTTLADELSEAADTESEVGADSHRRLEAELRAAKDQNKALTLYINKIIERLLQHSEFEHILDQSSDTKTAPNTNKDLPPPPPSKEQPQPSVLQRVKSIAVRPRPLSFMPSSTAAGHAPITPAVDNPDTAPSIPIGLGRSTSVRRGRPSSEQFTSAHGSTGGPAGGPGLVNALYKGPVGDGGQFSPTLRSAQTFFANPTRASSASTTPLHPPQASSGNFPGMKSETSSTSGDSAGDVATPPSLSPPRPDRTKEKGSTFTGGGPRTLRLVQENAKQEETTNKRASWFGWAIGAKKEDGSGTGLGKEDVIRE